MSRIRRSPAHRKNDSFRHQMMGIALRGSRQVRNTGLPVLLFMAVAFLSWYGFRSQHHAGPVAIQTPAAQNVLTGAPVVTDASTGFLRTDEDHAFVSSPNGASMTKVGLPVVNDAHTDYVYFLSPVLGWASVVHATANASCIIGLYKTVDGQTWSASSTISLSFCANPQVQDMVFHDAEHGWMSLSIVQGLTTHEGALFTTSDGGVTWNQLPVPYPGRIVFTTDSVGWLVTGKAPGQDNLLNVTHDGGHTWQPVTLPIPATYNADLARIGVPLWLTVNNGSLAVSYEDTTTFHSTLVLYNTADGGSTWGVAAQFPVSDQAVTSIPLQTQGGSDEYVSIGAALYRSTDGGRTWTLLATIHGLESAQTLHFADAFHGWFASVDTQCTGSKSSQTCATTSSVNRSADGGSSWTTTTLQ